MDGDNMDTVYRLLNEEQYESALLHTSFLLSETFAIVKNKVDVGTTHMDTAQLHVLHATSLFHLAEFRRAMVLTQSSAMCGILIMTIEKL